MTAWTDTELTTWGRTRFARVAAAAPDSDDGMRAVLGEPAPRGAIAYGGGRCYGDAALDDGGQALMTRALDRVLSFDPDSGEIVCEAGVTFAQLAGRFIGEGFCFPVSAATAAVTVGGAFANDIHSKNHHAVGSFGDHVRWIDLMIADGRVLRCSRDENAELFAASLGGVGLTGVVLRVCFTVMRVPSGAADARYRKYPDADAMIAAIEAGRTRDDFLFGWIDVFAKGTGLGRGILESARFAPDDAGTAPPPEPRRVPFAPPTMFVRPAFLRAFTARRFDKLPGAGRDVRLALRPFLFPLDHMIGFNRLYGRRGFYSIHAGFPRVDQRAGLVAMLEAIAEAQAGSFSAVMKPMGGPGGGMLSFPMDGMALAVDMPRRRGVEDLHRRLERIVLDHGGRLYVAKDALMSAETFAAGFPRLDEFRGVLAEVDPGGRFQSDLSRRLRLRG